MVSCTAPRTTGQEKEGGTGHPAYVRQPVPSFAFCTPPRASPMHAAPWRYHANFAKYRYVLTGLDANLHVLSATSKLCPPLLPWQVVESPRAGVPVRRHKPPGHGAADAVGTGGGREQGAWVGAVRRTVYGQCATAAEAYWDTLRIGQRHVRLGGSWEGQACSLAVHPATRQVPLCIESRACCSVAGAGA